MALPTLDLSLYANGDALERQQLASQLLDSLSQHGFVKLIGHGIPRETIEKLMKWRTELTAEVQNKIFFGLPREEKLAIAHPGGSEPQRGFSCVGSENSSTLYRKGLLKSQVPKDLRDAREHFDMGAPTDSSYPTRWPAHLPGFRPFMESSFDALEKAATVIMSALETALGHDPGTFCSSITHDRNASELRLNHYPAIPVDAINTGSVSRIWPHFDLGVITLLFQDEKCGGLEFEDRSKVGGQCFSRIKCGDPAEMVVNVSETLQRWTNGRLAAGLHRVSVPDGLASDVVPERFSVAYFCKADRDADVGALEEFVGNGDNKEYESITAIDYHRQRLQSAY